MTITMIFACDKFCKSPT